MATESVKPNLGAGASEPPAELRLEGQVLGDRYEIEAPLGEGGLGVVFRARDRQTGDQVAIKVLRELYGAQQAFRRRFAREARALSTLDHPHIVGTVDSGVSAELPYLVMELLEGTTLADVLAEEETLEWERVRGLFGQLLEGLIYVHEQGLLHRDLKPGNVFLEDTPEGERVKLLDFGLAKFVHAPNGVPDATLTKTGQLFGTPGYMPPEQLLGQPADGRADVYSATLILFEMLAGERPFHGNLSEMAKQQLGGTIPKLQDVRPTMQADPQLAALFGRGLAADPARRFASVTELRQAFDALPNPPLRPFAGGRHDFSTADTVVQRQRRAEATTKAEAESPPAPAGKARAFERAYKPPGPSIWSSALRWLLILVAAALVVALLGEEQLRSLLEVSGDEPEATTAAGPEGAGGGEEPAGAQKASDEPEGAASEVEAEPEPPPRWSAPSRDPWRGNIPPHLRDIRRHVARGGKGDEKMLAALRRHNTNYPTDPRGHLLLARMYLNREWQRDAIRQYEFAVLRQPSARADSHMLKDLLSLHDSTVWKDSAQLVAETYGPEAVKPIERVLRQRDLTPVSRKRLQRLRDSVAEAP